MLKIFPTNTYKLNAGYKALFTNRRVYDLVAVGVGVSAQRQGRGVRTAQRVWRGMRAPGQVARVRGRTLVQAHVHGAVTVVTEIWI